MSAGGGMGMGMGSSMLGGLLQGIAAEEASRSMFNTYQDAIRQQNKNKQAALGVFNQRVSTADAGTAQQEMQQGQQQRQQDYSVTQNVPLSVTGSGEDAKYMMRDLAQANLMGGLKAKLGGYGDWLQQQYLQNQQSARGLGQITNFAQGEAGVLPYKMYSAQHGWDDLAMVGAAFQGLGGATTNASAQIGLYGSNPGFSTGGYTQGVNLLNNSLGEPYGVSSGYDYATPIVINPNTGYSMDTGTVVG